MESDRRNSRFFRLRVGSSDACIAPADENVTPKNFQNRRPSVRFEQENEIPAKVRKNSQDLGRRPLKSLTNSEKHWLEQLSYKAGSSSAKADCESKELEASPSSNDSDCFVDASDESFNGSVESKSKNRENCLRFYEEVILFTEPYLKESIELHLQSFAGRGVVKIPHIPKPEQKIRATVVDWIFGVERYYKLPDMVSHIAIQTFDLILQALEVDEKDFQVVGGAAFWLASKLEQSKSISSKQMKKLIGSSCTIQRLKSAEEVVFKVLNYCLPRDSALSLFNYQLHVLKTDLHVDEEIRMIGQYVLESSMLNWSLAVRSYSFLASMSTMCAILLSGQTLEDAFWEEKAKTDVTFQPLRETKKASSFMLRKLMGVQEYGKSSGHLWIKFSSTEKLRVSLSPKLSAENIGKILKSVFCEEAKSSV